MNKQTQKGQTFVNLKEQNAAHTFSVSIRDVTHFYRIVNWLNTNVGKGKDKWTMEGRALRILKAGKSVDRKIYIFVPEFDTPSALYLNLL